ncbi:MAG: hypothetical protein IPK22_03085 [Verrucomicrobiaceae bacterium]|nr:hypothetical protein [Verrucomicrobiaceae bacterium]
MKGLSGATGLADRCDRQTDERLHTQAYIVPRFLADDLGKELNTKLARVFRVLAARA